MWSNSNLKSRGMSAFQSNYWMAVAVALIVSIVVGAFSQGGGNSVSLNISGLAESEGVLWELLKNPLGFLLTSVSVILAVIIAFAGILFSIFIGNVFAVGGNRFFMENREYRPGLAKVLYGFRCGHYMNIVEIMFLKSLYTFLWTLLLIVPGIIKSYEYRMVPYILSENPAIDSKRAFELSKRMMDGQKINAFLLDLSFIGWRILGAFTCNILPIFWTTPYIEATRAELYAVMRVHGFYQGFTNEMELPGFFVQENPYQGY